MKTLTQYILEAIKDTVRDLANSPDTPSGVINKMYMAGSEELLTKWREFADSKSWSTTQADAIYGILLRHSLADLMVACIENGGIIDPKDILSVVNKPFSLSDIINKWIKGFSLDPRAIAEIIACEPGAGGVAVGPGELALSGFTKNSKQNVGVALKGAKMAGDLIIGGKIVEVKGVEAILINQNKPDARAVRKALAAIGVNIVSGAKVSDWDNNWDAITGAFNSLGDMTRTVLKDYYRGNPELENFARIVDGLGIKTGREYLTAVAMYSLKVYWKMDRFDYILFINDKNHMNVRALLVDPSQDYSALWKIFINNFGIVNAISPDSRKEVPKVKLLT